MVAFNPIKILRSNILGNRPPMPQHGAGEPYVNFAENQMGVIDLTPGVHDLLAVRIFSTAASYVVGDHVLYQGRVYRSLTAQTAGSFTAANWSMLMTAQDTPGAGNSATYRNRIVNGDMRWDQRNEGATVNNPAGVVYSGDRWKIGGTAAGKFAAGCGAIAAAGQNITHLSNRISTTSLGAYVVPTGETYYFNQYIEADAVQDFQWGSSAALPVVLSFLANATIAGTYAVVLRNQPDPPTRSYVATFSLPTASVWTKITIPIPGDTAGTWVTSGNAASIRLHFDLGTGTTLQAPAANAWQAGNYWSVAGTVQMVATNGASLAVTGVQLEVGTIATPFEVLPPDVSLARCMRYYEKSYAQGTALGTATVVGYTQFQVTGLASAIQAVSANNPFKVTKRAAPTVTAYSYQTGASGKVYDAVATAGDVTASVANSSMTTVAIGGTQSAAKTAINFLWHWTADADF